MIVDKEVTLKLTQEEARMLLLAVSTAEKDKGYPDSFLEFFKELSFKIGSA